ncbi:MAG: DNA repair protein RecO [Microbacteriaceae bacterium]|nr:DNA repair protein RecO [Microbacteriaceae bacterium]
MPTYRDEAVVLRTHKLGEADRIVTLLTRYHGQVRAVAKGVRRTASKIGSRLEPFMVADIQFYEGRNLDTVTQVESIGAYGSAISDDYGSFTVANVMAETAMRLTGDERATQQYLLLVGGLRSLANKEHKPEQILDSYLLRALAVAGWAPNFADCTGCNMVGPHQAFVIQTGGVVCESCMPPGAAIISKEVTVLLGSLLAGEWEQVEASTARASAIVSAYSQWHIDRGLKSMNHLERM